MWLAVQTYFNTVVKRIQDHEPLRRKDWDSYWWLGYIKFKWYRWESSILRGLQQEVNRAKSVRRTITDIEGKVVEQERRYRVLIAQTTGRDLEFQRKFLEANKVVSVASFNYGGVSVWPEPSQVIGLFGTGGGVIRNAVSWAMDYEVPGAKWVETFRLDRFEVPVDMEVNKIWLFMEAPEVGVEALVNAGYQGTIVVIHPNANGIVKSLAPRYRDGVQWPVFAAKSHENDDLMEYGRALGAALVGGDGGRLLARGYKFMDKKVVPVETLADISIRF